MGWTAAVSGYTYDAGAVPGPERLGHRRPAAETHGAGGSGTLMRDTIEATVHYSRGRLRLSAHAR